MSVARHSKTQQPTGMTEPTHFAEESELADSKIFAQQSIAHDGLTMRATTMRNAGSNINRSSQCDEHAAPVESRDKVSPLELTKPEQEETHREEPIMIPQSTHSLLFTQPTFSLPFFFAVLIAVLSLTCLNLAMLNNLYGSDADNPLGVPVQVDKAVKGAQYLSLVIGIIMEEEIPSALYLLRMIPKHSLQRNFSKMSYRKFVLSAIVRLVMGYIYLFNMFLVIAQATGVLDIFYDMLALQFIQQLDDIAFSLAKIDVFGKTIKKASTENCFRVEFEKHPFALRKKSSRFLKALYFVNICALLSGMAVISVKQARGDFHCDSIFVTFGDDIWEEALVTSSSGTIVTKVLLYSYFTGVYRRNGTENGLPIYVEHNKYYSRPFETIIPAKIKYCRSEGAWVFVHDQIKKSKMINEECAWLLKSPETFEYDLVNVQGDWTVWAGTFKSGGEFSAVCNECESEADCNYHGVCSNGQCVCSPDEDYAGIHCEHRYSCQKIVGEWGDKWDLVLEEPSDLDSLPISIYDRPVYRYTSGLENNPDSTISVDDTIVLLYSGSRWFGMVFKGSNLPTNNDEGYWTSYAQEFHAFWEEAYTNLTRIVSDPTTESSPVGVDFFQIGQRGENFGPFGELFPMRTPKGSGYYRCDYIDGNSTAIE